MHDTLPLLVNTDFPPVKRVHLDTLQVNVGYRCNQSCVHCHVNAGPKRTEEMNRDTAETVLRFVEAANIETLDITGGAPELNENFRDMVEHARGLGVHVIDRCNLTILEEPGFEDLADYLAKKRVEVVASLPCYLSENVDQQRGKGVFDASIRGLQRLNRLGYGSPDSDLSLSLVYNPQGAVLPPSQVELEAAYREELDKRYGVHFTRLLTLANMPVGRFGSTLVSKGEFGAYMGLLKSAHNDENVNTVMCRTLLSVDWQGFVYDCDFNQMLGLSMRYNGSHRVHLSELVDVDFTGRSIMVRDHCFGCTAGQGSSCSGALN